MLATSPDRDPVTGPPIPDRRTGTAPATGDPSPGGDVDHTGSVGCSPADEGRHRPGADPRWTEWWLAGWCDGGGDRCGWVQLVLQPGADRAWFGLVARTGGDRCVAVLVDDVPLPPARCEIRTHGLWADIGVEEPLEQLGVGVEAFGLLVGAHEATDPDARGERVPVGLDAEWVTTATDPGAPGCLLGGRVRGDLQVGSGTVPLDGSVGFRWHAWGVPAVADRVVSVDPRGAVASHRPDRGSPGRPGPADGGRTPRGWVRDVPGWYRPPDGDPLAVWRRWEGGGGTLRFCERTTGRVPSGHG